MLGPVLRIGCLLVSQPLAIDRGEDWNLRSGQLELANKFGERFHDLIHHRRMKGVRGVQVSADDVL